MAATWKLAERLQFRVPSLEEIKDRLQGLSAQDLLRHREIAVFGLMLILVLFSAHTLMVAPEERALAQLRERQLQLSDETRTLEATGIQARDEALEQELNLLAREVETAEGQWQEYKEKGLLSSASKGELLKEITLLPPGFGWTVVKMEELEAEEREGLTHSVVPFRITGEGSFRGLVGYLRRVEQTSVPLRLENLEVGAAAKASRGLQATVLMRAAGIKPAPAEPADREG